MEDKFYSINEVSKKLQVAYLTVYRWIKMGKLTAYKLEKQYRVAEKDFNNFLKNNKFTHNKNG